jgi:hypothetical protein
MLKSDGAKQVYALVKAQLDNAIRNQIAAEAKLASEETGDRLWRENDENTFGRNPYHVEHVKSMVASSNEKRKYWEEVLEYTVNTFIGD